MENKPIANYVIEQMTSSQEFIEELKLLLLESIPYTSLISRNCNSLYIEFSGRFLLVKSRGSVDDFIRLSSSDAYYFEPDNIEEFIPALLGNCVILDDDFMRASRRYIELEEKYDHIFNKDVL